MLELNNIYNEDAILGLQQIQDESIDLIIADPPYFKVISEKWDYLWRTENDYIEWSKKWLSEAYRSLRKGGSFYLFGYFRMLSRLLPILEDLGFELRQQIVIDKGMQAVSGRCNTLSLCKLHFILPFPTHCPYLIFLIISFVLNLLIHFS